MKLPRDLNSLDLVARLSRFGYAVEHQSGSHMRLTSTRAGREHHITVPAHKSLKVGTLNAIVDDVALYLTMEKEELITALID